MRGIFTQIAQIPKKLEVLVRSFRVVNSGPGGKHTAEAINTFETKINDFIAIAAEEDPDVRLLFAANLTPPGPDNKPVLPKNWSEFFVALSRASTHTEKDVAAMDDPKKTASLGVIQEHARLLHEWYQQQEPQTQELLEYIAQENGRIKEKVARLFSPPPPQRAIRSVPTVG